MSKEKISYEQKLETVLQYINGNISQLDGAKRYSLPNSSFTRLALPKISSRSIVCFIKRLSISLFEFIIPTCSCRNNIPYRSFIAAFGHPNQELRKMYFLGFKHRKVFHNAIVQSDTSQATKHCSTVLFYLNNLYRKRRRHSDGIAETRSFQHFNGAQ